MHRRGLLALAVLSACGSSGPAAPDAPTSDASALDASAIDGAPDATAFDAAPDASVDAVPCDPVILAGGTDVAAQGWGVTQQGAATISYVAGGTQLATSTGGSTGGQLLLTLPNAVQQGTAYTLQVELTLTAVNAHNSFDSAAAIMGSFTAPAGLPAERSQMIYLDANAIGWADNTQAFAVALADGNVHTIELAVDAAGAATVKVDSVAALTRAGFTTTGTIAIGDQTNDPNVDATMVIKSVKRLCPL